MRSVMDDDVVLFVVLEAPVVIFVPSMLFIFIFVELDVVVFVLLVEVIFFSFSKSYMRTNL